jgi:hypothetical protein
MTRFCDGWVRELFSLLEQSRYEPWHTCLRCLTVTVVPNFLALGFVCPLKLGFSRLEVISVAFPIFLFLLPPVYISNIPAPIRFYFLPLNSAACCRLYNTFALLSFVPPIPIILFLCSRISSVQNSESLRSISMLFLTHRLVGFYNPTLCRYVFNFLVFPIFMRRYA